MAVNIAEKINQMVNKVNEKNPYYLLLLVLAGLLIGLYLLPIQFQVATLQTLIPKVRDLGQDIQNSQNNIQRLPQYQKELIQLKLKLTSVSRKIRTKEELPVLLETISRIAGRTNLKLEQVMPHASVQQPVLENADGKYFAIPIMVEAKSGYHDFGRFLNQLELEGIFSDLTDFAITSEAGDQNRHSIRMTLKCLLLEKKDK